MTVKYCMNYTLYTTVDITRTGHYRSEPGGDAAKWKEQNFQTVLQTLGIRANIIYERDPQLLVVKGNTLGFETNNTINVWQFDFSTERDFLFEIDGNPVSALIDDFEAVPYIAGLDECMEQNYSVFVTDGAARNIIFHLK